MRSNFNIDGLGAFGVIIGLGGLIFAAWQAKKTDDITKKLGVAMDEVEKKTTIDIQQSIVDHATEKAVDREVKLAVADTAKKVHDKYEGVLTDKVKEAVNNNLSAVDSAVEAKAKELVDGIDKVQFQKRITDEGAKILSSDFTGSLNGLLADAKGKVSFMIGTITDLVEAATPFRKSSRGMNFHID